MIKLYNSLTSKKEEFTPINKDHIKMYVCGPTVYNYIHIGNARSIIVFDVLFRLLKTLYPKVSYVRNITDIDDKIIKKANAENTSSNSIALKYTNILHEDLQNINILNPSHEPKATEHIEDIINIIQEAIEKGYAYVKDGNVLFNIEKYENYGVLVNLSKNKTVAGKRVEVEEYKINPEDFVLWKPSKQGEPYWESPWGKGRPGWHVECSAMSRKCLGESFDIHGGGQDLKFPHHENEIAISSSVSCSKVSANYWLHNGFLTIKDEKMSKSLNNFITLNEATKLYGACVLKIALLLSQYRQPLNFDSKLMVLATNICKKIYLSTFSNFLQNNENNAQATQEFVNALKDDLNTPLALTILQKNLKTQENKTIEQELNLLGLSVNIVCLNVLQNSIAELVSFFGKITPCDKYSKQSTNQEITKLLNNIAENFDNNTTLQSFVFKESIYMLEQIKNKQEEGVLNQEIVNNIVTLNAILSNKQELESFIKNIEAKLKQRDDAKALKNYTEADNIRNELATEFGVKIIDTTNNQSSWAIN